jgi:hypothetical protein
MNIADRLDRRTGGQADKRTSGQADRLDERTGGQVGWIEGKYRGRKEQFFILLITFLKYSITF